MFFGGMIGLNSKTEIEPQISQIDTDYEEVGKTQILCLLVKYQIRVIRG